MKRFFASVFWILTITAISSAQTTFYYPQIVNGQQGGGISWVTWILVTNSGTSPTSGSILFTQDDGTPFNISFFDADTGQPPSDRRFWHVIIGLPCYKHCRIFRIWLRRGAGGAGRTVRWINCRSQRTGCNSVDAAGHLLLCG